MERNMHNKSKINVSAAAGTGTGTGTGRSRSKSVDVGIQRNPLSDLSNLNLIPTGILRKLCSKSISTSDAQSLLWKSQVPVIPFQRDVNSSKSDSKSVTSIGSSNFNGKCKGQSSTRQLHPSSSPSSVKGDEDCELVLLVERRTVVNLDNSEKVNSPPVSWKPVEKANDKGKSVCMPLRITRSSQAKNKQKAVVECKPIVSPVSVTPVPKLNDKASVLDALPKVNPSEKTKVKGKETFVSLGSSSYDKRKDKGKAVAIPWSSLSEQTEDRGKSNRISCLRTKKQKESILQPVSSTPVQKLNQKARATAGPSKLNLAEKTKSTVVSFNSSTYDKTKDKGKAVVIPSSNLSEQTKDAEKSTEMLVSFPETNKQKESDDVVVSASSCPPVCRKRNTRDDLTPSRALTDPHPNMRKRRCTRKQTISDSEIQQQKAYFQEVDDFELEVEEA